jgi:hypothetical protein
MEVFSNIPREDLKRACSRFRPRLEEIVAAKCDFIKVWREFWLQFIT